MKTHPIRSASPRMRTWLLALATALLIVGCTHFPLPMAQRTTTSSPTAPSGPASKAPSMAGAASRTVPGAFGLPAGRESSSQSGATARTPTQAEPQTQFWQTPPIAPSQRDEIVGGRRDIPAPSGAEEKIDASVNLENIPLPAFATTVFATILKKNVSLDSALQKRTELVSLRTGQSVTARQLANTAAAVLRSYGVLALEHDGLVRLVPDTAPAAGALELLRSRSQPDVPARLRPVFHFYELQQANVAHASQWIKSLYQARVNVQEDTPRNALLLSGQSDAVASAIEALEVLDQPFLRGRFSARITPVFWSAQDLSSRLAEVLTAQGMYVANSPNISAPLLLIPVPQINSVIVFGTSRETVDHALRWARDLDRAPQARRNTRYMTYHVRNTDAKALAATITQLMGGSAPAAAAPGAPAGAAASPAAPVALPGGARVVVNASANSLILQANPDEYPQLRDLLVELDRPPRSALIMVTIAEIGLDESEQFGFNWLLKQFSLAGYRVNGNIGGAQSRVSSGSGLNLGLASVAGDPRAFLSALATSSRVRVLSNPSIVALNGEQASIQVGQDVPVLTSQMSSTSSGSSSGGNNLLQTVQYRNIGIILNITPVIHSAGRVELKITQEVSGVSSGAVGVGNSPIVTTRRVDTKLSALDGQSTLIGGLIREQRDDGNSGVPLAKDVPLLGGLFRSGSNSTVARTELVILLTPYIIEDDVDSQAITEAFRSQFSWLGSQPTLILPRAPAAIPVEASAPAGASSMTPSASIAETTSTSGSASASFALPNPGAAAVVPKAEAESKPYVIQPLADPSTPGRLRSAPADSAAGRAVGSRASASATEPSGAPAVRGAAAPASAPAASAPQPRASAPVPSGRPVTDPALLRELRSLIDAPAPKPQGR